jgi:hypothetical protein
MVTFTTVISLVCITWIAYNWNHDKSPTLQDSMPPIIEPTQPTFKVLPQNPGGAEVPYQDKTIYDKMMNNGTQMDVDEKLLPPPEEQFPLPKQQHVHSQQVARVDDDIEEYSILEDKTYYIKLSAGKGKSVLETEAKLLKKRYSTLLYEKSCAVKKVSNASGEQKYAVLIGPYKSLTEAMSSARDMGGQCSVISVRE